MAFSSAPTLEATPQEITLTLGQKEVLLTIRLVMAFLSMFGCFFVIGCMIKFKKLYGPQRLILILTLCNLGDAISSLLSFGTFSHESDRSGLCYIQGVVMQFFQVAAFCWSSIIAINLWLVIVRKRLDVDSLQPRYHLLVWSVVLICTLMPNFTKAYGPASVWCWISKSASFGNGFRIVSFFVPFYISWVVIIVCYIWISRVVAVAYAHMRDDDKEKSQRQLARLRWYPIIFVVLYIPATVNRVYNWLSQDDIFVLFLFQVLTAPAVGFVNSIAYGMDTEVRHRIANSFIRRGMCSYCFGDVLLDEDPTSRDASSAPDQDAYDEAEIVDGVLDDFGALQRPSSYSPSTSKFSDHNTIPLDPIHSYNSPQKQKRGETSDDTVAVDF